jgi:NitT/TauT family transport system substrate-binding protein
MGYFAEEGLDVSFVSFQTGAILLPQVVTKKVDFGWATPGILVIGKQPGRDPLPVKMVYNWTRTSNYDFVVLADSPFKTLADLKGKKIGITHLGSGNIPQTIAALRDVGLEPSKDVFLISITQSPAPVFVALKTGQVDAVNMTDGVDIELEIRGLTIRHLPWKQKFAGLFGGGFFVHEDTIRERPNIVAGFGRALTKSIIACDANPKACVRAMWKNDPTTKRSGVPEAEALADAVSIVKARSKIMFDFPAGAPHDFGAFPAETWKNYIDILADAGQIKNRDIPLDSLYTNQFVAAYNKFDIEAVRRQARDIK